MGNMRNSYFDDGDDAARIVLNWYGEINNKDNVKSLARSSVFWAKDEYGNKNRLYRPNLKRALMLIHDTDQYNYNEPKENKERKDKRIRAIVADLIAELYGMEFKGGIIYGCDSRNKKDTTPRELEDLELIRLAGAFYGELWDQYYDAADILKIVDRLKISVRGISNA